MIIRTTREICLLPDDGTASRCDPWKRAISIRSRFASGERENFKEPNADERFVACGGRSPRLNHDVGYCNIRIQLAVERRSFATRENAETGFAPHAA